MSQIAIVTGATGLVGSSLLTQLLEDPYFTKVISISRRDNGIKHTKLSQYIRPLDDHEFLKTNIKGDILFCCLGTTIKKAGSKEAFKRVDLEIPVLMGEIALENQVSAICVVSSIGANANGSNFYLRTKGEMENAILNLGFKKTTIVRPSMLLGNRKEFRFGEEIGKLVMIPSNYLLFGRFKKYRAIKAETVARAMIIIQKKNISGRIFESDQLEKYGSNR